MQARVGQIIQTRNGFWRIREISVTSDGFMLATASAVDDYGAEIEDGDGWPVITSLFLGSARD